MRDTRNPLVSVVIPAYNEEQFMVKALQSLAEQKFTDFEFIVVDNNSTDKTAEIAKRFGAKVIHERQRGVGYARQSGFLAAKGDIIVTTDADTIVPPGWLARIVDEFQKDKGLVAFGGLYTLYSGPLTARIALLYFAHPAWFLDKIFSGGWGLPGVNFAVRKDAFLRVGGFKTDLALGEDAEISRRLKRIGKVLLDPRFLVQTSGRRYRGGLIAGIMTYIPNGIMRILFNKHKFTKLPTIRSERLLFSRYLTRTLVLLVILSLSFFYVSHRYPLKACSKRWILLPINQKKENKPSKCLG